MDDKKLSELPTVCHPLDDKRDLAEGLLVCAQRPRSAMTGAGAPRAIYGFGFHGGHSVSHSIARGVTDPGIGCMTRLFGSLSTFAKRSPDFLRILAQVRDCDNGGHIRLDGKKHSKVRPSNDRAPESFVFLRNESRPNALDAILTEALDRAGNKGSAKTFPLKLWVNDYIHEEGITDAVADRTEECHEPLLSVNREVAV
jgi:hypothetical protein